MPQQSPSLGSRPTSGEAAETVPARLDRLLRTALSDSSSDIHLEPTAKGYEIRQRIDGLLAVTDHVPADIGKGMVTRLMVLAQLLTYRHDIPQEGRLLLAPDGNKPTQTIALRLSIMPTTHGLRAVVRLPADHSQLRSLHELGLPPSVLRGLEQFARSDSGMLLITGPAGSGKTTTIYALLQHLLATSPGISIIALEDPVERDLPGVTQIEVSPFGELTYAKALRSILRQDPQVLMLGEIRDAETASIATQAALSGHRLIATLHAGTPAGAVARLLEMGLEPYQLTSALFGIVSQRLVRKHVDAQTYRGRFPLAELATINEAARQAILARSDMNTLDRAFKSSPDFVTMRQAALEAIAQGWTDRAEVERVTGFQPE